MIEYEIWKLVALQTTDSTNFAQGQRWRLILKGKSLVTWVQRGNANWQCDLPHLPQTATREVTTAHELPVVAPGKGLAWKHYFNSVLSDLNLRCHKPTEIYRQLQMASSANQRIYISVVLLLFSWSLLFLEPRVFLHLPRKLCRRASVGVCPYLCLPSAGSGALLQISQRILLDNTYYVTQVN